VTLRGHPAQLLACALEGDVAGHGDLLGGHRLARPVQHLLDRLGRPAAAEVGARLATMTSSTGKGWKPGTAMRTWSERRTIS
jgi:hypothetical protein